MKSETRNRSERTQPDNRRRHTRYGFAADVAYKVFRNGADTSTGRGRTVDMSAGGILLQLERVPTTGSQMELSVAWPGLFQGEAQMRLLVRGPVVRREGLRTAVRIAHHEFRTASEAAISGAQPHASRRRLEVA
jgi:c-di-GMP-binding flagellar brake protein YcgR